MKRLQVRDERGFTLVELLVAMVCTTIVLGGAVALTGQIQSGYKRQLEDSAGEQEARYAMDWIGRYLRSAGNNPKKVTESDCPGLTTHFYGVIMDPNGDGVNDDITLQSDSNPPDGKIGGEPPDCDQANEHVNISFDSVTHTIVFLDEAVGEAATTRTDNVIDGLEFVYLDSSRAPTTVQADVFYVQTRITIRTRTIDAAAGTPNTRTLFSEIRVRNR
jgi:prepilin-type N-terminal cleavage/methylation domain-containing protein